MFTLAHFSDPHLALQTKPAWSDLLNKRITGYMNLRGNRELIHADWAIEALVSDMKSRKPDHVALTGDLINLSLKSEFCRAEDWLQTVGKPANVSVIPGNHDIYVQVSKGSGVSRWSEYMKGDDEDSGGTADRSTFPYLRIRGNIALIGLSSALVRPPFFATGRLGNAQIKAAETLLKSLDEQRKGRIIMIHHPVIPQQAPWHKRLEDAEKFLQMIARTGAEMILHGHNHTDTLAWWPIPGGRQVPVIGVPSASSVQEKLRPPAQYNLYGINQEADDWKVDMVARRLNIYTKEFETFRASNLLPDSRDMNITIGEEYGDARNHAENE